MDILFRTWMQLMFMPFTMQAALASTVVGSSVQFSSSFSLAAPARRSTARLSLVASNNWVRSHRSVAALSVVPK